MYQYVEKTGILRIGEEKLIDRVDAPGWALAWSAIVKGSLDAKYVRVHAEIDGPDRAYPIDFTPYGMKEFGVVSPISYGGFLSRYDDTNKVYAGAISPTHPMPFSKRIEIKLIAPSAPIEESSALPIDYTVVYVLAKVIDEKAFRRSLLELHWPIRILEQGGLKL
jgi:hypothetical protein